jgi:hypothetical protein
MTIVVGVVVNAYNDGDAHFVTSETNGLDPMIGQNLNSEEIQQLINAGNTVTLNRISDDSVYHS